MFMTCQLEWQNHTPATMDKNWGGIAGGKRLIFNVANLLRV